MTLLWRLIARLPPPARDRINASLFRLRWGVPAPPAWSDLTGYELLLGTLVRRGVLDVEGDVVEIGAFLGGGTYKLAKLLERRAPGKTVVAVDVFDPGFDLTASTFGRTMAETYGEVLAGRSQRAIYDEVTAGCGNLVTLAGDSARVELPVARVAYAHIDGNHDPAYVRSDFELVWEKLSPRGLVSFDDYGADLPQVTQTIHALVGEHADEIAEVWRAGEKTIFLRRA